MNRHGPKRLAILGSTGSIGRSALAVAEAAPDAFEIYGLSALRNVALLAEQAERFGVRRAVLPDGVGVGFGSDRTGFRAEEGLEALESLASDPEVDLVVNALVGAAGLRPTVASVRAGKSLALANKESLVMAGGLLRELAEDSGSEIIPIDSEHSAIFRCLMGTKPEDVAGLLLTASGGPLRDLPADALNDASVDRVLDHPTWEMGRKVTVDSATLFNKGLEVIEAHWLFDLPLSDVDVVIHRESVVHSLVRLRDGTLVAQLGIPDMRVPIQFALFYPDAPRLSFGECDLTEVGPLHFESLDVARYPCFELALEAARRGGAAPAVAATADEVGVEAFLEGAIRFGDIRRVIERTLDLHGGEEALDLDSIERAEAWARRMAREAADALAA